MDLGSSRDERWDPVYSDTWPNLSPDPRQKLLEEPAVETALLLDLGSSADETEMYSMKLGHFRMVLI